jgi:glutamyl-Q tRNA(Asp) synthetase
VNRGGRFAPSPTGPLHLGSLLAALASRLDALHAGSRWHLRIDDLDTSRCRPGFEQAILRTLAAFGFRADPPLFHQSARRPRYEWATARLEADGLTFACDCSRRERAALGIAGEPDSLCVSDCRQRRPDPGHSALRADLGSLTAVEVQDRSLGRIRFDPAVHRDVVIRRRDGLHAYPLAVVLDDADQGVTDVVRGADLLDGTPVQIALHQALGLRVPTYLHVPLLVEPDGSKLAKSRRSVPVDATDPCRTLAALLELLGQPAPPADAECDLEAIWGWAAAHWSEKGFGGTRKIPVPPNLGAGRA